MTDAAIVGRQYQCVVVDDLKRTQIVQYAGASGDYNPLHTDERYAVEVAKSPSVFAHGMLTAGMTAHGLRTLFGAAPVLRFGGRFLDKVWPGDSLTLTATVAGTQDQGDRHVVTLDLVTTNQRGRAVYKGSADLVLDPPTS
ncbi:hypothetical protein ASG84_25110 [Rhodococcus sp. Leaf278]|uniref:MaoC family dehydratase n=1 Tax=Rhodococcus sp. Leaf278 TaxID=1736319 RepID=UPI00070E9C98|nr:MaoC family dehydratase [Rhodococcus sp. Leaf278]KQU52334.1 hypothetical protein ASG84_25110 [Rhodococcus sp. Leaf278]